VHNEEPERSGKDNKNNRHNKPTNEQNKLQSQCDKIKTVTKGKTDRL